MSYKRIEVVDVMRIDGGLRYIISRYPDAAESENKLKRKFKTRDEKTASAALKKWDDGTFTVTDFGGDSKSRNAIAVCQLEDGLEFQEALQAVAAFYGVEGVEVPIPKPDITSWDAKPGEGEGFMAFKFCEFDMAALRTLYSVHAWTALGIDDASRIAEGSRIAAYYHFKCLESYTRTKDGKTMQFTANDQFPMFLIDEGEWQKIYKPKADKKFRFMAYGTKPEVFIHGLRQANNKVKEMVDKNTPKAGSLDDGDKEISKKKKSSPETLESIILCTGGSDALNVAALGYNVIWLNSETAQLSAADYKTLQRLADQIYNLPDIDLTGKRQAHALAMEFVELKTIWLPEALKKRLDGRGNPSKDVRDYLTYHKRNEFKELLATALPYQFWDQELALDRDGEPRMKFGKLMTQYVFNNVHAYNFLAKNGYARYRSPKEKDGYIFVHVKDNIVSKIEPSNVRDFIHGFLEERKSSTELRNKMYTTNQLADSSIANLPYFEGDFKAYDANHQYLFFAKTTWKVTAAGIIDEKPGQLDKHIWDYKVVDRKVKILPDFFEVVKTKSDVEKNHYDIKIKDDSSMFFRFLIQTSRLHWRKEYEDRLNLNLMSPKEQKAYCETNGFDDNDLANMLSWSNPEKQAEYKKTHKFSIDGGLLTNEEIEEQKQHLLNKIFSIGYLLHRYKNDAKPWAVYCMDGKLSEDSESHGGAGKGILAKALYKLLKEVQLDGRNPKLLENNHLYENVDQDTDIVYIEDAYNGLNFQTFFPVLTSGLTVNPKQKRSFSIPFEDSPKFLFDTNYGDRYTDPSSIRRKLVVVFSDYYHQNNGDYNESRSPNDDFNQNLFTDFDEEQWNLFYNFMAQCLKFYLSCPDPIRDKIEPPMNNVSKRNLVSEMGDHFRPWADVYFSREAERLDKMIMKEDALEDFIRYSKLKNYTSQRFKKALRAWCAFNDFALNPKELLNKQGSIIRKNQDNKAVEFVYIQTPGIDVNDIKTF